jgi:type IV secretion system protein VirB10
MSDGLETTRSAPPKEDPEKLVLRGKPRAAVHFRRGRIIGISGVIAVVLVTLSWFSLDPPRTKEAVHRADRDEPERTAVPDALAHAPADYREVPRLGPPLPGDLGGPILDREQNVAGSAPPGQFENGSDAERAHEMVEARQSLAAQRQAALSSSVIVELQRPRTAVTEVTSSARSSTPAADVATGSSLMPTDRRLPDLQLAGTSETAVHRFRSGEPRAERLTAGTIIPASLVTGLNSDLPGKVIAQVTENVCDSATGRIVLIPQGSRLIGSYETASAYGQHRAFLAWTKIVFPNGSSIALGNVAATDAAGYTGLEDEVDSQTLQLLKGIALSTLLGVGTQLSLGTGESDLVRAIRESAQQSAADAGSQVTSRNLDVRPTITVRPGWRVDAILDKDLTLPPWAES